MPGIPSPKKKTPILSLEKSSINLIASPKNSPKTAKISNPTSVNDMNSNVNDLNIN